MKSNYTIFEDVHAGTSDLGAVEWREAVADILECLPEAIIIVEDYSTQPYWTGESYICHDLAWRFDWNLKR